MAQHLITLPCERLETGMYVAELDRSWLHTPFAGPGLLVSSSAQIESLRRCCNYVYVDPLRSEAGIFDGMFDLPGPEVIDSKDALAKARTALGQVTEWLAETVQAARKHGRVELGPVTRAAQMVVDTALKHREACLWLLHLNGSRGFLYRRALGTSLHAVVFGKHLGFDEHELLHLAIGGLLLDIGKTSVPVPILAKPGDLNQMEKHFVERHVWQGFTMVRLGQDAHERVMEMLLGHHERLDGSGYPRRLRGTEIPLYARIAAIVDCYDALTLDRRYAVGISAHDALRVLNGQRDKAYDAALVGEFIHALGVYPTGTRVMMMDGNVGVVCGQNPEWPLRPLILQTEDDEGVPAEEPRLLAGGLDGHIARALPPAPAPHNVHTLEQAIPLR
ncbi:MAG: DUF3391 domain-containing protein [Gammaproteobacteria bacterium]|nr:DUF3391 domain-containing protein [Gammaproteobacteria bacterium]